MSNENESTDSHPTPDNFPEFIPWACKQLQLDCTILIKVVQQHEYISPFQADRMKKIKSKAKLQSRFEVTSDIDKDEEHALKIPTAVDANVINISAMYDHSNKLTQLKFEKNKNIPRLLWKIIGLIIKYQTHLTNITINGGLNSYTLHEICKFLNMSHLTELILDYSFVGEANFYLLFEFENQLKHISLAGCDIDDDVIAKIASKLKFPSPASKNLNILNLASNKIADDGAKNLADCLRSNRRLNYLNLSNNRITDTGVAYILNTLEEFPLRVEELIGVRERHMVFLKKKNELIKKALQDLRSGDIVKGARKKTMRPMSSIPPYRRGKLDKESSLKSLVDQNAKSLLNIDVVLYDKAITVAETELGDFEDPFNSSNTILKDGIMCCKGNNALCYLNLSYNHVSFISLKKVIHVLRYQKSQNLKPGLVSVVLEGNPLPQSCTELIEIDDLIEEGLETHRRVSTVKKRGTKK